MKELPPSLGPSQPHGRVWGHRLLCIVFFFSAFLFWGCTSTKPLNDAAHPSAVGKWHGEIYKPEYKYLLEWQHDMRADGTYTDTFVRLYADGRKERRTESGKWWLDGQKYSEFVPGTMEKPDEYQVLMLSDRYFILQIQSVDTSTLLPGIGAIYIHKR